MSRTIIKIKDYYLEWSSIVDAPVTFGMKRDEFEAYHLAEYGRNGHQNFEQRMAMVDQHGSSSMYNHSAKDVISINRAGEDEAELTLDEIYRAYCLRESIGNWAVPTSDE